MSEQNEQNMQAVKTAANKQKFLDELGEKTVVGNVLIACRRTHLSRTQVYEWRKDDREFAKAWDKVIDEADEVLGDEMEYSLRTQGIKGNVTAITTILKRVRPKRWIDKQEGKIEVLHKVSDRFAKTMKNLMGEVENGID